MNSYDGFVSRHLNRRLSRPAAAALARTAVTPNVVTLLSTLLAFGCAALIAFGQNLAGGILIQVSSVTDGIDGDLARARGLESRLGAVLDAVLDRYADAAIYAGMTVYAAKHEEHPQAALVGLLALAGALVVSYSRARIEASTQLELSDGLLALASRDVRLLIAAAGTAAGQAYWTLILLGALSFVTVGWRLAVLRRLLGSAAMP